MSPSSTKAQYVIRIVFFCFSVISFIVYVIRLSLMHRTKRVLEQRFVSVLGLLLIFFNDPFLEITLTRSNNTSSFFSQCFLMGLPLFLVFFWMCILEVHTGIRRNPTFKVERKIGESSRIPLNGHYGY